MLLISKSWKGTKYQQTWSTTTLNDKIIPAMNFFKAFDSQNLKIFGIQIADYFCRYRSQVRGCRSDLPIRSKPQLTGLHSWWPSVVRLDQRPISNMGILHVRVIRIYVYTSPVHLKCPIHKILWLKYLPIIVYTYMYYLECCTLYVLITFCKYLKKSPVTTIEVNHIPTCGL